MHSFNVLVSSCCLRNYYTDIKGNWHCLSCWEPCDLKNIKALKLDKTNEIKETNARTHSRTENHK